MHKMWTIQLLCFIWFLSVLQTYGRKVSCDAPDTYEGREATITCQFDENISTVQEDVIVFVYKDGGPNPVVRYGWVQGRPFITAEPGFKCNNTISDTFVVKIPVVKHEHSGKYKCLLAPSEKKDSKSCTLHVLDDHEMNPHRLENIAILVLITLLGLLIVIFVTIIIISYKKGWISNICHQKESALSSEEPLKKNMYSNVVLDGMSSVKGYTKITEEMA